MPPQIDNNISPVTTPITPPTQPEQFTPNHTRLIWLAVVMIFVGLLATSYFLYQGEQIEMAENINILDSGTSQATTTEPMSDWQTYRNIEFGFELQYPHAWVVKDGQYPESGYYKIISFEATTTDPSWLKDRSTAPVFQIDVLTTKQYSDEQKWCADMQKNGSDPSECYRMVDVLGKNSQYVFMIYSPSGPGLNGGPIDFTYDLYQVGIESANTFKFTK